MRARLCWTKSASSSGNCGRKSSNIGRSRSRAGASLRTAASQAERILSRCVRKKSASRLGSSSVLVLSMRQNYHAGRLPWHCLATGTRSAGQRATTRCATASPERRSVHGQAPNHRASDPDITLENARYQLLASCRNVVRRAEDRQFCIAAAFHYNERLIRLQRARIGRAIAPAWYRACTPCPPRTHFSVPERSRGCLQKRSRLRVRQGKHQTEARSVSRV